MDIHSRIKKDLVKILLLMVIIFGSFAVLYYFDQKNNILSQFASILTK
jgi:hypothetical protein